MVHLRPQTLNSKHLNNGAFLSDKWEVLQLNCKSDMKKICNIKKNVVTILCLLTGIILHAQGSIKGEVKDTVGNPIPYLQILLSQNNKLVNGAYTDESGVYQIFEIEKGTYDIFAGGTMNCQNIHTIKDIHFSDSEVKFINFSMICGTTMFDDILEYIPPSTFTRESGQYVNSTCNYQVHIPKWLNLRETGTVFSWGGTLPAVEGIENAILIQAFQKYNFKSFKDFRKYIIEALVFGETPSWSNTHNFYGKKELGKYKNIGNKYKVYMIWENLMYHCEYILVESKTAYLWINFTSTPETFDINIDKFYEFMSGFEITNF